MTSTSSNTTSTTTHSSPNSGNDKPYGLNLGTAFGVDILYIIIGGLLAICLCLCVLLACVKHKKCIIKAHKEKKADLNAHTEVVNGMKLEYKYTKKAESFNPKKYKSSVETPPIKKVNRQESDQAFDRVVQLPNTTVQRNPFHSVVDHSAPQHLQQRQSPLNVSSNTMSAPAPAPPLSSTVSASPPAPMQPVSTHSASPRMHMHPAMRSYHSDERQYPYHQPVHTVMSNPVMSNPVMPHHPVMAHQPQSYPYAYPQPHHGVNQHQYHQTMPNRSDPVHNAYVQSDQVFRDVKHARNPSESSSEYKTEYALTEAMTVDTNMAVNDVRIETGTEATQSPEVEPEVQHHDTVVDTLTRIVNNAIEEDREESYVMELPDVDMNTMEKRVSYGGSSIDVNREPSQLTIASGFAGSTNTLV